MAGAYLDEDDEDVGGGDDDAAGESRAEKRGGGGRDSSSAKRIRRHSGGAATPGATLTPAISALCVRAFLARPAATPRTQQTLSRPQQPPAWRASRV